ncbi:hypothetical protein P152DRAFT_336860 [Eremomyces bilateralis CBS 781.70]|uniref:Uncharacterized protein n=1 Tax=Eremomyces bilateralis CBS 781.70 TaxID=1392243 RepID=A0A6G1G4U3_9PEZI|nr:uncharacterized protein P152DRAFT_336860 [Eremomyces bilateralis CBS 781.70]KAF1813038.1 hypothetical protein P152DRAFT_336860 [Eremomyces bilateralis CBS 781.70]
MYIAHVTGSFPLHSRLVNQHLRNGIDHEYQYLGYLELREGSLLTAHCSACQSVRLPPIPEPPHWCQHESLLRTNNQDGSQSNSADHDIGDARRRVTFWNPHASLAPYSGFFRFVIRPTKCSGHDLQERQKKRKAHAVDHDLNLIGAEQDLETNCSLCTGQALTSALKTQKQLLTGVLKDLLRFTKIL